MISLDPEFVGTLAPEPKLTSAVDEKHDIPFARLPRLERLRVQGKADETEEDQQEEGVDNAEDNQGGQVKLSKAEKEKKKMRGKNKSLKRYLSMSLPSSPRSACSTSSFIMFFELSLIVIYFVVL